MSEFKSPEERIELLEKKVNLLMDFQALLGKGILSSDEVDKLSVKMMIAIVDQQNILTEFIFSQPTLGEQAEREKLLLAYKQNKKNWDEVVLPFLRRTLLPPLPPTNDPPNFPA